MLFFFIITFWVAVYYFFDLSWLKIPWTPLALIGTAVAFVIGFQNNAAYGRIWEARKIWGGIVNTSRTFGVFVQDMVNNEYAKPAMSKDDLKKEIKVLTYRHIAWMNALRHAMRAPKPWETTMSHKTNQEWNMRPPELDSDLDTDLKPYISDSDYEYVMSKGNKQTAMLYLQSHHLRTLKETGVIWEFSFLELEGVIQELFTLQGKSERIKNFPYPRHFATLNHFFMWIFVLLLPFALVPQFASIGNEVTVNSPLVGDLFIWLAIPFYVIVAWIFHTMERIGRTGENPFEGTANDVPISTISRGIEIDLRQNLGESEDGIPKQFEIKHNTQF
ncbi:bestrophin family protein [uncultured Algibacter sp.]|uniref:bestrophin family protein n=1 Tax=uncultured Algibacter sp. TaxID=298659 RepID=UPI0026331C4C|nr:bestrophin family ion channel [uncultured Algibacter sp.]